MRGGQLSRTSKCKTAGVCDAHKLANTRSYVRKSNIACAQTTNSSYMLTDNQPCIHRQPRPWMHAHRQPTTHAQTDNQPPPPRVPPGGALVTGGGCTGVAYLLTERTKAVLSLPGPVPGAAELDDTDVTVAVGGGASSGDGAGGSSSSSVVVLRGGWVTLTHRDTAIQRTERCVTESPTCTGSASPTMGISKISIFRGYLCCT